MQAPTRLLPTIGNAVRNVIRWHRFVGLSAVTLLYSSAFPTTVGAAHRFHQTSVPGEQSVEFVVGVCTSAGDVRGNFEADVKPLDGVNPADFAQPWFDENGAAVSGRLPAGCAPGGPGFVLEVARDTGHKTGEIGLVTGSDGRASAALATLPHADRLAAGNEIWARPINADASRFQAIAFRCGNDARNGDLNEYISGTHPNVQHCVAYYVARPTATASAPATTASPTSAPATTAPPTVGAPTTGAPATTAGSSTADRSATTNAPSTADRSATTNAPGTVAPPTTRVPSSATSSETTSGPPSGPSRPTGSTQATTTPPAPTATAADPTATTSAGRGPSASASERTSPAVGGRDAGGEGSASSSNAGSSSTGGSSGSTADGVGRSTTSDSATTRLPAGSGSPADQRSTGRGATSEAADANGRSNPASDTSATATATVTAQPETGTNSGAGTTGASDADTAGADDQTSAGSESAPLRSGRQLPRPTTTSPTVANQTNPSGAERTNETEASSGTGAGSGAQSQFGEDSEDPGSESALGAPGPRSVDLTLAIEVRGLTSPSGPSEDSPWTGMVSAEVQCADGPPKTLTLQPGEDSGFRLSLGMKLPVTDTVECTHRLIEDGLDDGSFGGVIASVDGQKTSRDEVQTLVLGPNDSARTLQYELVFLDATETSQLAASGSDDLSRVGLGADDEAGLGRDLGGGPAPGTTGERIPAPTLVALGMMFIVGLALSIAQSSKAA